MNERERQWKKTIENQVKTITHLENARQRQGLIIQKHQAQYQAQIQQIEGLRTNNAQLQANNTQLQANNTQLQANNTQLQANNTQLANKNTTLKANLLRAAQYSAANFFLMQELLDDDQKLAVLQCGLCFEPKNNFVICKECRQMFCTNCRDRLREEGNRTCPFCRANDTLVTAGMPQMANGL